MPPRSGAVIKQRSNCVHLCFLGLADCRVFAGRRGERNGEDDEGRSMALELECMVASRAIWDVQGNVEVVVDDEEDLLLLLRGRTPMWLSLVPALCPTD